MVLVLLTKTYDGKFVYSLNVRGSVTYKGKASHAAAFPWEGVNALDAAVMAYQGLSVMRQQMKPNWRIHGKKKRNISLFHIFAVILVCNLSISQILFSAIISNGRTKPNIIPEESELRVQIRCPTLPEFKKLMAKAEACCNAAAISTGCQVSCY